MNESSNPNSIPPGEFLPDPTTDHPHRLQATAGAAAGALFGTAIGTIVAGPIGAAIGVVAGGIAGGCAGKVGAEMFDPSAEADYWREHHDAQPFVNPGYGYGDYEPAYRTGYANYTPGESFAQAEADLQRYYEGQGGASRLSWEEARPAALAAWEHLAYIFPLEAYGRS